MEPILHSLLQRGYTPDGAKFGTGRPDRSTLALTTRTGLPVVAKPYPLGGGEITYANMLELWRSSFGERRQPPGLPRPIEYLPDERVLIMERLPGRPFVELGASDPDVVDNAIRLVACLHACEAHPSKERNFRRIVRSVGRKANAVAQLAPQFAGSFRQVVEALQSAEVEDLELVPCHGDFTPRNVLVGPEGLSLIDWDRLQQADPARDIAYFGAWCWSWALRQRRPADWSALERAVAIYDSQRPAASIGARLCFHIAAGLMRIAHGLITLWPDDAYLVPQIAEEALRQLR
ncbi:MAG: aminoglycoside phosphotransferase family protein [Planctomycetes bacterium]|nr:aminoglycoside phosphotransferase family protein [Planctomycetota bacterium]